MGRGNQVMVFLCSNLNYCRHPAAPICNARHDPGGGLNSRSGRSRSALPPEGLVPEPA